ncbi:hypothetical protein DFH08DRAFT_278493 [Mycena albidolilacea]|uniref:DUF5648 domain-containing protein n=1 Tax=Mycena albidolilacea TaxID=1033008 RepID=A0AAD7AQH1_9AGAR|nr:hypothetical protein DFH08DRAFT_278493 [Mycena albidolilacea]
MKHILLPLLLSVTVGLTSGRNITSIGAARPAGRSAETCGNPANTFPFYRMLGGTAEYLYIADTTIVNTELRSAGWTLQTIAGLVFVTQEVSTVPFYRLNLKAGGEIFYTANTTELTNALNNGYSLAINDPEVYIYPTQICGSVPFYYLKNAVKKGNFYTVSESERLAFIANEGYTDVEIAGYVLPVGGSQCD